MVSGMAPIQSDDKDHITVMRVGNRNGVNAKVNSDEKNQETNDSG